MKILLVRLSSMGDLIHTLPAVEDLAVKRPDIELHWLSEAGFADIAKLHPFVKKVHAMRWRYWRKHLIDRQTWSEIGRLKNDLRQERFDYVLDSQGLLKSALFGKFAGVPMAGFDKNSAREPLAAMLYQHRFTVEKGRDAVWRNRQLFARMFDYDVPSEMRFGLQVPQAGRLNDLQQPYYVALHATSRDSKLWPVGHWRNLLALLNQYQQATVYLPWGNESEHIRAQQIAEGLPFAKVCDKLNLMQAAYLLDGAVGVAGVDTGLLHLANALDKPVVGIYTDTDPAKTGVQSSAWAVNLGNAGQIPTTATVYEVLMHCVSARSAHDAV